MTSIFNPQELTDIVHVCSTNIYYYDYSLFFFFPFSYTTTFAKSIIIISLIQKQHSHGLGSLFSQYSRLISDSLYFLLLLIGIGAKYSDSAGSDFKVLNCTRLFQRIPRLQTSNLDFYIFRSKMGKAGRDWTQIYSIYGMEDCQTLIFLLIHAILFASLSVLFLLYFNPICTSFESLALPGGAARFAAGFTGSFTALSAVCLFFAAGNIFYSSVALQWEMAQRMVSVVSDWSTVKHALDVGCGRGILLNAVAMQLKKEGSSGRVVGLDRRKTTVSTLRTAKLEGVQEYVTCREGDARTMPFGDNYFDVVVSSVFVHTVGKEFGQRTAAASAERVRVLGEVVRVLKGGGVGVVWDLIHVPEYVQRLQELKMEDIRVSERVTAFMVSSHMVSFRKPSQHMVGPNEVRLDWRFHNIC